jgi:hypothetical protein
VTEGADVLERLMELFGARSEHAGGTEPGDASEVPDERIEMAADEAGDRADFGEGIRLAPRRGPALHHIEEMRGHNASIFPSPLAPADDADNGESGIEGRVRSA